MRALSKLINENEPDLVLFVGEALVGNDGVNQLQMFNQVPLWVDPFSSEKHCFLSLFFLFVYVFVVLLMFAMSFRREQRW